MMALKAAVTAAATMPARCAATAQKMHEACDVFDPAENQHCHSPPCLEALRSLTKVSRAPLSLAVACARNWAKISGRHGFIFESARI
jgi:hypothetical protein